jgi:hypothetical protein
MTEAQQMLLENSLLGNVRVFLEIRFQHFRIGFVRRRLLPMPRILSLVTFLGYSSLAALSPSLLLQ